TRRNTGAGCTGDGGDAGRCGHPLPLRELELQSRPAPVARGACRGPGAGADVAPVLARHSHAELDDTPCVDGGIFVLMGKDENLLRQVAAGERERARDYAAWLLGSAGG